MFGGVRFYYGIFIEAKLFIVAIKEVIVRWMAQVSINETINTFSCIVLKSIPFEITFSIENEAAPIRPEL